METKFKINVAKDFSKYPAGRFKSEGDYTGEHFLLNHLMGKIIAAISNKCILEVDLTGIHGYPSSFISGSFGKLSYEVGLVIGQDSSTELLKKHLKIVCKDSSTRAKAVEDEIEKPVTSH